MDDSNAEPSNRCVSSSKSSPTSEAILTEPNCRRFFLGPSWRKPIQRASQSFCASGQNSPNFRAIHSVWEPVEVRGSLTVKPLKVLPGTPVAKVLKLDRKGHHSQIFTGAQLRRSLRRFSPNSGASLPQSSAPGLSTASPMSKEIPKWLSQKK